MYNYTEFDLYDTLSELHLNSKRVRGGKELQLDKCPFCENSRHKISEHFSFKVDTGQFKCIKCQEQGNLITFRRMMNIDAIKSNVFKLPDQNKVKKYTEQPKTYYEKYSETRGISVDTLKMYGVGKVESPKLGVCRTYQYVDLDGKIVNVKYINRNKEMKVEYQGKKIYYGLQFVDFEKDYLHVVEGEDDVHAMVDMQLDNVVSVPFGVGNYFPEMGIINQKFKKIYIIFDNDENSAGQEGAKKFAHKAGVWKCWNVLLPFKDPRECLQNGIDLFGIEKYKSEANQFEYSPDDKCRPGLNYEERLKRYCASLDSGDGLKFGYDIIDNVTGGLRPGEVMSIVANPGSYKTTLLMNLIIKMASTLKYGFIIFFSLEMAIESEFEREIGIISGKTRSQFKEIRSNEYAYKTLVDESYMELKRIIVSEESFINLNEMKKIIKRTEEVYGEPCVLVACDYSDFVEGEKTTSEYETIKEVANGFKSHLCRSGGMSGIMLYQTNRQSKSAYDEVHARSGKGGTPIEAGSDFQIGLWRNNGIIGRFTKHRRLNDKWDGDQFPYFRLTIPMPKTYQITNIYQIETPEKEDEGEF